MNISTSTPIFKFATIRSATDEVTSQPELEIQPTTILVKSLIDILESDKKQPEQIQLINQKLQAFIQSPSFFKSKAEVVRAMSTISPISNQFVGATNLGDKLAGPDPLKQLHDTLYDNIVVRILTKSTTNEIFKLLTENIKTLHLRVFPERISPNQVKKLRIILPERLVLSFSPPKPIIPPVIKKDPAPLLAQLQALTEQKQRLQETMDETLSLMATEQKRIVEQQAQEQRAILEQSSAALAQSSTAQIKQAKTAQKRTQKTQAASLNQAEIRSGISPVLDGLEKTYAELGASEKRFDVQLTDLNYQVFQTFPYVNYVRIGEQYVDVENIRFTGSLTFDGTTTVDDDAIIVHHGNCSLKFPFQVADLRVVEQQTVGYVPGEIAHINNTQQGELHEKITRRLKRIEEGLSLITEDETFRETDTQSNQKFTVEKAASEIQSEETSINVNASVSAKYGVVTASVDAGYSTSQSAQNANSASESYAKEIVERVVERASNKIRKERSVKTLEEFEETVKHVIDNTKATGPKCYVFRWLIRLVRGILKNYGKRLIFQIDVAHPSHYYLSRSMAGPEISLPTDPRKPDLQDQLIFGVENIALTVENITRQNYPAWAARYNAKLEPPPEKHIIVSYVNSGKKGENSEKLLNPIPDGYCAVRAWLNRTILVNESNHGHISVLVGRSEARVWLIPTSRSESVFLDQRDLSRETKFLPLTIFNPFGGGYTINIEIDCELTPEAELAWKTKCYYAILEAYDNLKAEAENKMSEFDPNRPGLNPARKAELIKTELKKGALSKMFRCNPFWITDKYEVGNEYDPDCCTDSLNAEKVRFLETVFDWSNITYELYPYLYADKDNWAGLLSLSDDDPHFEAFLQASFATVRIPVHRDSLKETAAVNFIMNNSIANYEVVPESMKPLLAELENGQPTKFTVGLDGEDKPIEVDRINLGIFPVPTDLVILECGVENGVKPIGFPQTEAVTTDVSIPKQYSPAIIADRCEPTPDLPPEVEL